MKYHVYFIVISILIMSPVYAGEERWERLLETIAHESQVPAAVLGAVCTYESQTVHQGQRQPWPWTLNVRGRGFWFKNRESAVAYADIERQTHRNFDVGLCQINWRWHGHHFSSINELIDPERNLRYAALYLSKLRKQKNSWISAIGAYHSPSNSERARAYVERVLSASSL